MCIAYRDSGSTHVPGSFALKKRISWDGILLDDSIQMIQTLPKM